MAVNNNRLNRFRYTLYAPGYDLAARLLDTSRKKSIQNLNVQAGDKVLIVGAGTGIDLEYLPKGCHITATDLTPAMIRQVEKRNHQLQHQLHAMVMDGQSLAFEDACFDKVILHLILSVIPDPEKALHEAGRVLKAGGTLVVFDKFVAPGQKPSLLRRAFNLFTNLFFSNIIRSFEVIAAQSPLEVVSDRPANLKGAFRLIVMKKQAL
ncbi:class I SAM-dependent methyltransferase [Roseimarinus sediminis]|jgi:ubiquinone/menaquinone biosynthesis C-methylase UbiE|uniref:class I SAM-dependent methyltransferase n=1 Tax=Roseimarinus sediminis TaxID=1610899 RepID=UPI003D222049